MRKVDRTAFDVPSRLAILYANDRIGEENLVRNEGKNAKAHIYAHVTVKNSLESLYKDVCFLCQVDVSSIYDVEHFLPWSKHYPERAYEWSNLHQSCKSCNNRKKKNEFKEFDTLNERKVVDIKLLDPSVDDVEQLITFDPDTFKAVAQTDHNEKASLTAIFLNDPKLIQSRQNQWIHLLRLLSSNQWGETFIVMRRDYINYSNITLDFSKDLDGKVGSLCYRLASGFLSIHKEYNVCINRAFLGNTETPLELIKKYAKEYCDNKNIPMPVII